MFYLLCYWQRWMRTWKADVVHVHNMPNFLIFAAIIPRIMGKQIILDHYCPVNNQINSTGYQPVVYGLSHGDFDLALRGLLGEKAPLSASTVARLKQKWQGEYEEWSFRSLQDLEVVYLWVDGVYVKAGLEKEKDALLVAVAGLSDGRKVLVALEAGHRESEASWSAVLRTLRDRGMQAPCLVIGDGHLGIWAALCHVFPQAEEQRCWNHRILNVLDKLPKKAQARAKAS